MPWSADFFEEVSADRHHGSSAIFDKFLSLLLAYLRQVEELDGSLLTALPGAIVKVRSDMAPFYFAALQVSELLETSKAGGDTAREQLMTFVEDLQQQQAVARDQIIENARGKLGSPQAVMLHSNSHTVSALAKELLSRETKIYISDAYPDCEGEQVAQELAGCGFEVTLLPDDAKCGYVSQVDLVLLGSDWVSETDFTNKIGTQSLALAAFNDKKQVVVATDGSKMVPGKFRPQRQTNRVRLSKNLYRAEPLFEEVDNQLVDTFITNLGIFTPSELGAFVETRLKYVNFQL
jgi:translation initiation factor 2B subunit (eIF-2B alpha/beta/delta family)